MSKALKLITISRHIYTGFKKKVEIQNPKGHYSNYHSGKHPSSPPPQTPTHI